MKMYPQVPHMVLNSHNVPPPDYQMSNSWKVAAPTPPAFMFSLISATAEGTPGKKFGCVIFNSHGSPGIIHIGTGITLVDKSQFDKIKGKATEIWIIACQVAGGSSSAVTGTTAGQDFCQELSERTGAVVTASTRNQSVEEAALGYGEVDFYEGQTFIFRPGIKPFQAQP
jgi:hypothetical protein